MKKILAAIAMFAVVGGVLFAQNTKIDASNELYSETIYREANGPWDDPDVRAGFWGFRETAEGKITTETWTLQARLRQWLWSLGKTTDWAGPSAGNGENSVNGDNWENSFYNDKNKRNVRVNFWYRPLAGIELGVGNDFASYYQVPAGYMLGSDNVMGYLINTRLPVANGDDYMFPGNNAAGARWAPDGFALNITKVPNLLVSFNLPYMAIVDEYDFAPKFNAGAHYTFGENVNLGVTYHGGINPANGHVFGLYGQFKNDVVRIPLGATIGFRAKRTQLWTEYADKARIEVDFAPDFSFRNGMQLGISVSWGMAFGSTNPADAIAGYTAVPALRKLMPFVVGLYYKWPINNAWTFDVRSWGEFAINNNNLGIDVEHVVGQFYINPKIAYKLNAHNEISVGVKIRSYFAAGSSSDFFWTGFAVPVAWKWTL